MSGRYRHDLRDIADACSIKKEDETKMYEMMGRFNDLRLADIPESQKVERMEKLLIAYKDRMDLMAFALLNTVAKALMDKKMLDQMNAMASQVTGSPMSPRVQKTVKKIDGKVDDKSAKKLLEEMTDDDIDEVN